jgi:hypothetical protein
VDTPFGLGSLITFFVFLVLSFNAKRKDERKGAQKAKLMALLPTSPPEPGPKAINFAPFGFCHRTLT